jgi:hypothetical protein
VPLGHPQQRGVEAAGAVVVRARGELVLEAEGVEEAAEPRVVVRAEAVMRAEGVGMAVSGRPRKPASISRFGTLSGTFRSPSMSSLKATRREGRPVSRSKARRTQVVRATSPKVPMCGRPEGP